MWYKLKRILIYPDGVTEKQVYPHYIFDFQHNWDLWWTQAFTSNSWMTTWFDSWQWWYWKSTYSMWAWAAIQPPQWVYDGRWLTKVIMYYYLPNTLSSCWLKWWNNSTDDNKMFRYRVEKAQWNQVWFTWSSTPIAYTVWEYTGEITLEVSFTDTWATGKVNWNSFTISSSEGQYYPTSWKQNHFRPSFIIWWWSWWAKVYLRKIEVYTW